ncbi:MAG: hypothetical protein KDB58_03245 [Solirubrobacterales bacterium]|nr:hypothetical protein [Solirubrobacterales bacterium]MCB8970912.1 hypothetical protein [Thermoleophilales bacterium]MCO5326192.1 hypothetical protein [Solirubrobacterales bacterium]
MNAQPPPPPPPPSSPQPGGGAPAPQQPPAYPAQPGGTPDKGNGGLRVLAAIGVVVLAFVALVGFIAFADIAGTTPCDDVNSISDLNSDGECYDGSSGLKTIVTIMGFAGSALIAAAAVMSLMFAIRGRGGRPLLMVLGAGVVLFGLSLAIG